MKRIAFRSFAFTLAFGFWSSASFAQGFDPFVPGGGNSGGATLAGNNTFTGTNTFSNTLTANGSLIANSALNGWVVSLGAQDPASYTSALTSAGTGNAAGDQLTLNDGCTTHTVIVPTAANFGSGNSWFISRRGSCLVAPASPISVLSSTGTGTGAQFTLIYRPNSSQYSLIVSGDGIGNTFDGGSFPNLGLYGQENYFAGALAGQGFIGGSGGNAIVGVGSCYGNGQTFTGSNNACLGNDSGRDLYAPTGQTVNGNTVIGTTALRDLGSVSSGVTSGINSVTAVGSSAMGSVTVVGGPANDTAVGAYACPGSSTGDSGASINLSNSTCLGATSGQAFTYLNAGTIIGTNIANTVVIGQDILLIGTGYTAVEPPTTTIGDYMNINNMITGTGINTPTTGNLTLAAGTTTIAGNLIATPHNPTLTSCGTGPTLSTDASSLHGTVTEGTTATGCTITWATGYTFASTPDCVVTSPTGSTLTSYTAATGSLTLVNASATGDKFTYVCMQ